MSTGFKLRKTYCSGYCLGIGAIAQKNARWRKMQFFARCFLLEHPRHGLILIDTGYGMAYFDAIKKGWGRLYNKLLPVFFQKEEGVAHQLAEDEIDTSDLSYLLLTHFHPDHIGSLNEFSNVPWIYRGDVLRALSKLPRWKQFQNGFLQGLVPEIPDGSIEITESSFGEKWHSFAAHDLFQDESLMLVDLPGHAIGQMGAYTPNCLFAADALWTSEASPHSLGLLLQKDKKKYKNTLSALKELPGNCEIIPTHTMEPHE